ncbi:DUF4468 domain-containing protein [bacterium]|nr:DUF4468 domain-containing protein [bacterium]
MKKYIILIATLVCLLMFSSCAVTMGDIVDHQIEDSSIIDCEGWSKDELFDLATKWKVEIFVDSEAVIEHKDREAGTIFGKYVFYFTDFFRYQVRCTVLVDIKDEKMRISFKDPYYKTPESKIGYLKLNTVGGEEMCHQEWARMHNALVEYIESNSNDEW